MAVNRQEQLDAIGADGFVTAEEVLLLRRDIFADGVVDRAELGRVFKLRDRAPEGDLEWEHLFAELCADFFLREEEPNGYLTSEEFNHLRNLMRLDRETTSRMDLLTLITLQRKALSTPDEMSGIIANGLRDLIAGKPGGPQIDQADSLLIRNYLYAMGGGATVGITKSEAELLFDLNDISAEALNHPDWYDLFKKAIAVHLMQYVNYVPLSREDAVERHERWSDTRIDTAGFLSELLANVGQGMKQVVRRGRGALDTGPSLDAHFRQHNRHVESQMKRAEEVTLKEASWLADRIGRDGHFHDAERDLLNHIRTLGAELPPNLKSLVDQAA